MASIENLEIIVDVDIASALAALEDLQEELRDLAESIERVDSIGTEGIGINTNLETVDDELAALKAKIEAFEASNELDINTNIENNISEQVAGGGSAMGKTMPGRLQMMEASRAGNVPELFDFMDFPGGGDDDRGRGEMFKALRRQAGKLTDTLDDFDLRMADMHNMVARLVPLLLVFIGVIPAAVTALVGLAAAAVAAAASLASITALGALGVGMEGGEFDMQRLTDVLEDIKSSFLESFGPLAERLEPIFMDAIDGLERFFQAVANQGDALMALTDEAKSFGSFLIDFVPDALRTLSGLVEALSPLFAAFGNYLDENFNSIVRKLASLTIQAAPSIAALISKIAQAVPWIVKMSIGFARVGSVVLTIISLFGKLLDAIGIGPKLFGAIIGATLAFASALTIASLVMRTFSASLIFMTIKSLLSLGKALLAAAGRFISLAFAEGIATGVLATFIAVATLLVAIGLAAWASDQISKWLNMAGSIDSATQSLKDFNRVSGKTDGFNPYGAGTKGAAAADVGNKGRSGSAGSTVINIESSGDPDEDRSNARYGSWRQGRTSGGNN